MEIQFAVRPRVDGPRLRASVIMLPMTFKSLETSASPLVFLSKGNRAVAICIGYSNVRLLFGSMLGNAKQFGPRCPCNDDVRLCMRPFANPEEALLNILIARAGTDEMER